MAALIRPLQLGNFDPFEIVVVLIAIGVIVALYLLWIGDEIFKKRKQVTGSESLLGKHGIAATDLTAEGGEVNVDGIIWKAMSFQEESEKTITKGESIIVIEVSSLTLIVKRLKKNQL